ncbi:MAG: Crp/Fnr family transcriptional regulator [Mangrovibacterium sp.]
MIEYLKKHILLSKNAEEALREAIEVKTYLPNEHLFLANDNCCDYFFIQQGLARVYMQDIKGKDQTLWLVGEEQITSPIQSMFRKRERKISFSCELLTASEVVQLKHEDLIRLVNQFPEFLEMFMLVVCQFSDDVMNHIAETKKPCRERVLNFIKSNKATFGLLPFKHLASYLGMTAEGFSRVKSKMLREYNVI